MSKQPVDLTAATDQVQMILRDMGRFIAEHRQVMIENGVPRRMANRMTEHLHTQWTNSMFNKQVDLSSLLGGNK